jgi:hypothetical protein
MRCLASPATRLALLLVIACSAPALAEAATSRGPAQTGAYQDGQRHGKWTFDHRNGAKAAQGEFRKGRKHGTWSSWSEDGKLKQVISYKDGYENGKLVAYYPDGTKAVEGGFLDGRRHGDWREWYEDGRPRVKGRYTKGIQEGAWEVYYGAEQVSPAPTIKPGMLAPMARRASMTPASMKSPAVKPAAGRPGSAPSLRPPRR